MHETGASPRNAPLSHSSKGRGCLIGNWFEERVLEATTKNEETRNSSNGTIPVERDTFVRVQGERHYVLEHHYHTSNAQYGGGAFDDCWLAVGKIKKQRLAHEEPKYPMNTSSRRALYLQRKFLENPFDNAKMEQPNPTMERAGKAWHWRSETQDKYVKPRKLEINCAGSPSGLQCTGDRAGNCNHELLLPTLSEIKNPEEDLSIWASMAEHCSSNLSMSPSRNGGSRFNRCTDFSTPVHLSLKDNPEFRDYPSKSNHTQHTEAESPLMKIKKSIQHAVIAVYGLSAFRKFRQLLIHKRNDQEEIAVEHIHCFLREAISLSGTAVCDRLLDSILRTLETMTPGMVQWNYVVDMFWPHLDSRRAEKASSTSLELCKCKRPQVSNVSASLTPKMATAFVDGLPSYLNADSEISEQIIFDFIYDMNGVLPEQDDFESLISQVGSSGTSV